MSSETAIFAGGCFWCTQAAFVNIPGVIQTRAGYCGGKVPNPTYDEVCQGHTGHVEVLEIEYDPQQINYAALLKIFWQSIDPTDAGGQFADRGQQYHTAIFVMNEQQKKIAEQSKQQIASQLSLPIATQILPAQTFYPADEFHQNYQQKYPVAYQRYYQGSGRQQKLNAIWHKK
ncbi:MAG: hypothetical protein Tsb005_19390 [Gammaproteobacteria bacterium]